MDTRPNVARCVLLAVGLFSIAILTLPVRDLLHAVATRVVGHFWFPCIPPPQIPFGPSPPTPPDVLLFRLAYIALVVGLFLGVAAFTFASVWACAVIRWHVRAALKRLNGWRRR